MTPYMVGIETRLQEITKTAVSRQEVLKQIWSTQGPDALLKILEREPAARESGIVEELRREADDLSPYKSSAAERLVQIADAIEGFRKDIDRFARVETVGDLLEAYKARPFCHATNFNRLLGVFWLDALRAGDSVMVANLRRAMRILSSVYAAIHEIQDSRQLDPKVWARKIASSQILSDPHFHQFIDSRAHFLATQKSPHAEGFAQLAVYIRTCSRVAPGIVQIQDRDRGIPIDGPIKIHIPVSADQAELWFLVSRDFGKLAEALAEEVASGSRTIQSCMDEAAQYAARNPSATQVDAASENDSRKAAKETD